MNVNAPPLAPAIEVARANPVRMPNESPSYRAARTALLAEEIELRGSRRSAGRCRPAARSSATIVSRANTARPTSPDCSATSKRW